MISIKQGPAHQKAGETIESNHFPNTTLPRFKEMPKRLNPPE